MKCALVRPDGSTVHTERHPTDAGRGPDAVVATILDVAEGLAGKARADGLAPGPRGNAVHGVVD
ncbi:ROK family protein, partial [Micromonospora sp. DH15]|nr:ROK family protein [Micromonospora sp. DH15]